MSGSYKLTDVLSSQQKAMIGSQLKNKLGPIINMDSSGKEGAEDGAWRGGERRSLETTTSPSPVVLVRRDDACCDHRS